MLVRDAFWLHFPATMKNLHRQNFATGLAILLMTAFVAFSQTATPTPKVTDDEIIKVDSRLIVVPVSVTDTNGQPVFGLTAQDFRLTEESRSQVIDHVSSADKVPLEIALLFDVSASTDKMFQFELETAAKFLKDVMRTEDRATVFTIGAKPILVRPRDTSESVANAIRNITPTKEFTAFYDTVAAAADYLKLNAPDGSRKVILVISDGEDTNSARISKAIQDGYRKINVNKIDNKSLYELTVKNRNEAGIAERRRILKLLQDVDTVFYSINPAGSSLQLNKMSLAGQENMHKFAEDTGGTAFLPKFQPLDTKDDLQNQSNGRKNTDVLDRIFRQLANELRSQYLVQYYSDADFPVNKFVNLDVKLQNRGDLRVRARQGYFVKN